jgi:hypothetical protein
MRRLATALYVAVALMSVATAALQPAEADRVVVAGASAVAEVWSATWSDAGPSVP